MPVDKFKKSTHGPEEVGRTAFAITPHDTNDLDIVARYLLIGGEGNLTVIPADGTEALDCGNWSGVFPLAVKRVLDIGTDATKIIGVA